MTVTRAAHAKLNVFLRVLGRRDDGYHDVETVILPLEVHDVVTVEEHDGFEVVVDGPRASELEDTGGEELVTRAAYAWARAAGRDAPNVRVTLEKRVPIAAGLGGGSADAAATILALDELHGTDLPRETQLGIAAAVGADVPALLQGGAVYADGRGDLVTPIHSQTTNWVVVPAPFGVSTEHAYAWWDEEPQTGPDPGAVIAAIESGNDDLLGPSLFNDLQASVVSRHPEIAATIDALLAAGALGAVMSGSGPTVVALARHMPHADQLAEMVPGAFVTAGPPRTMDAPSGVV
jgi:4-diphosphocytidyl-2-C-methyl-D-erythritol kinase